MNVGLLAVAVSALTLGATILLKGAQKQAARDVVREASEVPTGFGLLNVPATVQQGTEAFVASVRLQLITVLLYLVALGGTMLSAYLIWKDYFGGPAILGTAERAAKLTPVGQVTEAIKTVATPAPVEGNPTFERGSRARAIRDLLAKRIAKAGGAGSGSSKISEPHAVATAVVKKQGERNIDIPERQIQAEMKQSLEFEVKKKVTS